MNYTHIFKKQPASLITLLFVPEFWLKPEAHKNILCVKSNIVSLNCIKNQEYKLQLFKLQWILVLFSTLNNKSPKSSIIS